MQTQKSYDQYFNIVRRYEILLNKIKNMYSKSSNSISGYFNNENLEIGINGIKDQYLKGALQNIERYIHNADNKELQKNINISESIHIQGIKDWLIYYQVLAHESFHLLQSLTLQTTSEYVYWIRQFRDYEFMAYVVNLSSGGHWEVHKHQSILDIMPDIADADFCDWFSQKFTNDGVRLDLLESYKKNIYGISTLELVEGSAVAFQELVTHSPDANIHNFSENGIYRNAYHYFLIHNEEHLVSNEVNKIIFLYLCYTALYFGSASKLHYGAEWGDPVKLFIHLCQFVKKYQKLLSVTPSVLYHQYDNFKNINKRKGSYSLKEFTINSISNRYIKDLPNKLPKEKLLILSNHINLLKIIKENICDYFFQNNVQHMRNVRKHLDRKMKPLNQFLTENIPLFGNYYFPAFLYSDVDISHKFINLVGNNGLSNVIVQTTNGKSIENDIDTALLKCMKDFKDYIQKGAAWCCEKHGFISSKRDMINCTEEDSLRQRLKMFGQHIELKNLVLFE